MVVGIERVVVKLVLIKRAFEQFGYLLCDLEHKHSYSPNSPYLRQNSFDLHGFNKHGLKSKQSGP